MEDNKSLGQLLKTYTEKKNLSLEEITQIHKDIGKIIDTKIDQEHSQIRLQGAE